MCTENRQKEKDRACEEVDGKWMNTGLLEDLECRKSEGRGEDLECRKSDGRSKDLECRKSDGRAAEGSAWDASVKCFSSTHSQSEMLVSHIGREYPSSGCQKL